MTDSVYIKLAAILIKADLRREEREWKRKVRRTAYEIPWNNAYLLRDIGLEPDGLTIGTESVPDAVLVERRIRHIRRVLNSRIAT